jgi:hypothetical protein
VAYFIKAGPARRDPACSTLDNVNFRRRLSGQRRCNGKGCYKPAGGFKIGDRMA